MNAKTISRVALTATLASSKMELSKMELDYQEGLDRDAPARELRVRLAAMRRLENAIDYVQGRLDNGEQSSS